MHDGYVSTAAEFSINDSIDAGMIDVSGIKVMVPQSGLEFYTYTKTGMGIGENANNPWTYELPDPISRLSWDNYIVMSVLDALELGIEVAPESNGAMTGNTLNITVDGHLLENVPVWIQPGQTKGTLGLAIGYGRTAVGKVGNNVGVNAFELLLLSTP